MNSQNDPYYSNFLRENLEIHDQLFTYQILANLHYHLKILLKPNPQPRKLQGPAILQLRKTIFSYLHGLTLVLIRYKAMIKNVRHIGKEFAIIFISTSILHLNAPPLH